MPVPYIFTNRSVPQHPTDIDANQVNADFAALSDGTAWNAGIVTMASLSPAVLAAMGGYLMNFLINGSYESFSGGQFQNWALNNGGDGTATLTQSGVSPKFGLYDARITTGTGPATTLSLYQSVQNFTDFAGLQITLKVWVNPAVVGTVRARIYDGVGSNVSSYNVGSGIYEPLIVTRTVTAVPTQLTISIEVDQPGAIAQVNDVDGVMLVLGNAGINYIPGLNPLDALSGLGNQMNIIPVEVPNGIIVTFTMPGGQAYIPGKIAVYLRGLRMTRGVDYNEAGGFTQVQFLGLQVPQTGDGLFFDYVTSLF